MIKEMQLHSSKGCRLAIGKYPQFHYDASGGGGEALIIETKDKHIKYMRFSPKTFQIPPLSWRTTKFLNLPLPPGIIINITMEKLEGNLNKDSGQILLNFEARFSLKILFIFKLPDLIIKSLLKSDKVKTNLHEREGMPLQEDGKARLVGIAKIAKTGNYLLDKFLFLPNDALAELVCEFRERIK